MPRGSISDLYAYLSFLKYNHVIGDFELRETKQYYTPFPNLDFYLKADGPFEWDKWAEELAKGEGAKLEERESGKVNFSWLDLYVLSWLSIDARMKFSEIATKLAKLKGGSVGSWKVKIAKTYGKTISRLIRGYGLYILPVPKQSAVRVLVEIRFSGEDRLASLINNLEKLPYPLAFHPFRSCAAGLLHIIVPVYEYYLMVKVLRRLARLGIVKSYRVLLPNRGETWSNVMIYEAYDEEWKFSYDLLVDKFKSENL